MTTFSYTATIDDSECAVLHYAVTAYIEICQAKLTAGEDRSYGRRADCGIPLIIVLTLMSSARTARLTRSSMLIWPSFETIVEIGALENRVRSRPEFENDDQKGEGGLPPGFEEGQEPRHLQNQGWCRKARATSPVLQEERPTRGSALSFSPTSIARPKLEPQRCRPQHRRKQIFLDATWKGRTD